MLLSALALMLPLEPMLLGTMLSPCDCPAASARGACVGSPGDAGGACTHGISGQALTQHETIYKLVAHPLLNAPGKLTSWLNLLTAA